MDRQGGLLGAAFGAWKSEMSSKRSRLSDAQIGAEDEGEDARPAKRRLFGRLRQRDRDRSPLSTRHRDGQAGTDSSNPDGGPAASRDAHPANTNSSGTPRQTPTDALPALTSRSQSKEGRFKAVRHEDCEERAAPTMIGGSDVPMKISQVSQRTFTGYDATHDRPSAETMRPYERMPELEAVEAGSIGHLRHDSAQSATAQNEVIAERKKKKQKKRRSLADLFGHLSFRRQRGSQDVGYEADDEQARPYAESGPDSSLASGMGSVDSIAERPASALSLERLPVAEEERGRDRTRRGSLTAGMSDLPAAQQADWLSWSRALGL
ncbi:hypothetical protein LTR85_003014 [Meristemomyces frigidus]|nr:hypothetical protein LTR85_003014 [Meristemomyces frigidus]